MPRTLAALLAFALLAPLPSRAGGLDDLGAPPRGGVRFVLVRHGQALSNLEPTPGHPPPRLDHLTELGWAQSARAAEALKERGVAWLAASPAVRAQETASVIGGELETSPHESRALRPLELGEDEDGRELAWQDRIDEWEAGRDPRPKNGESLEDLGRRLARFLGELRSRDDLKGRAVVLVTHSEAIAAYLGELQDVPGARRYPPTAANGSLTVVDAPAEGEWEVRLSGWLPPEPKAR